MSNILLRADSSSTIGTGHIMRDLVLASKYKGCNITFATQKLAGNINKRILKDNHKIHILKSNEIKELTSLINDLNIDLLIIDNYKIDYKYEKAIKKETSVKIMSFDDTYEKHYCDVLLNHNIGADEKKYKSLVPSNCKIMCGERYTLFREEFKNIKIKNRKIDVKKGLKVFVAMGGTDNLNININLLKVLNKIKNIKINLITTNANINLHQLKKYVADKDNIKLHVNSNKMAKIMNNSDFAIVTPSVTVHEVMYMNLPFIAIKTIDNQSEIYNYIKNDFLAIDIKDIKKLKKNVNKIITDYDVYVKKLEKRKYYGKK